MRLRDRPLPYLFLEAQGLAAERSYLEQRLGLPVVETDDDPGHRHGVVKYDAGPVILSLNLSPASRFRLAGSDGLTIVCAGGTRPVTDPHGHHFVIGDDRPPVVAELRLRVDDPAAAVPFYRDVLGLRQPDPGATVFATGSVPLVLEQATQAVDGRRIRHDTYLLVFHTPDIDRSTAELAGAGLRFTGRGVGSKRIGRTIHFTDPSGHRFCLYEPSDEALTDSAGPTLRQITTNR